jgi:hypothetical protein
MYIDLFIPFCDYLLIVGFFFYSTGYSVNFSFKTVWNTDLHVVSRLGMSELSLWYPVFILVFPQYKCTLPHLLNPHSLCLVLFSYIYYIQCLVFDEMFRAISHSMNFDNPQNTLYITVELHLSERWLAESPVVLFGLALLLNLSRILHK